jgi:hypothetical protein
MAPVALVLLAAACTATLDTDGLEDQIRTLLRDRGGPVVTDVTCPDDVEVRAGAEFECTATGEGTEWIVQVTQADDRGKVQIEIVGAE